MTLDRPDYPQAPGFQASDTSFDAAESMAGTPRLCRLTLRAVRAAGAEGLTADEAAMAIGVTPFACRPRVTEISKLGLIRDSGARRTNLSGRKAIVWVAVPPGELAEAQAEAERESRRHHKPNEADRAVRRIMKETG